MVLFGPPFCLLLLMVLLKGQPSTFTPDPKIMARASSDPDVRRYQTFVYKQNKKKIDQINSNEQKTYKLKMNQFATLTESEIKQKYFGFIPSTDSSIAFAKTIMNKKQKKDPQSKSILQQVKKMLKLSSSRTTGSQNSYQPTTPEIQTQVLAQVEQFFQNKNIPKDKIRTIIPKHRYNKGDLSKLSPEKISSKRILASTTQIYIEDVDWSCVSGRVRAQGDCGACYAFATVDNVGALLGIYYYTFFIELSIQEVIDCAKNSLVFGCDGGFFEGAFAQMMDPGIHTAYAYPYTSSDLSLTSQSSCKNITSTIKNFTISSFGVVNRGDCNDLKLKLQKHPVSVGISGYSLAFYSSGVFDGCQTNDTLDHAALLVGFKNGKGWKVKNSWGTSWGQNGYLWLKQGNTCNICQVALYPILSAGKGSENFLSSQKLRQCPSP